MKSKGIIIENGNIITAVKRDAQGLITQGLTIGNVTAQNQQLIIAMVKGELKEHPLVGVGIINYLNDENATGMLLEIKKQLKSDGMTVNNVAYSNGELTVEAAYE